MSSIPPIIAWDYQFAPNSQKSRNYLYAAKQEFKICEQPFFIPRPILRNIGITYRRVPVLSIGKDIFPDNASFIDALQSLLEASNRGLRRRPDDRAYEAWGYRSFWVALPCVPADFNTKQLQDDRKDLFPLFGRPDYARLQTNAASELRSLMETAEKDFLNDGEGRGPWIGGASQPGLADVHAMWMMKWALKTLGMENTPGLERGKYPKTYAWIESIPHHDEAIEKDSKISEEDANQILFGAGYAMPDIGIDATDPLGYTADEEVYIEPTDAEPGQHPQYGRLIGLNANKVVIQLENSLRVHFPRIGYVVHRTKDAEGKSVLAALKAVVGLGS